MKMVQFSYPALSNRDYGWFRIGGPGLANCMFFAAKAYVHSRLNDTLFIDPTWIKFSFGPWLRHERDKRLYNDLFYHHGVRGWRKFFLIRISGKSNVAKFSDLGNYFGDLNNHYELVKELFDKITRPETVAMVKETDLADKIAVHVRLGDYLPELRVDLSWYKGVIENIIKINPNQQFELFSDGSKEELVSLLQFPNVKLAFYGNAYADMFAISKCKMTIASDSTFSAWGAFLGQKPILFSRRHYPPLYNGDIAEAVIGESCSIPKEFETIISSK